MQLPQGWNKRFYYWYLVNVDGKEQQLRSHDDRRMTYKEIIQYYKDKGAKKVWVEKEFRDYYKVFC